MIIIPYSLKNKNTKGSLPNSMLNPLISSLSPSRRSKGARLVSIRDKINQIGIHVKLNSWKSNLFSINRFLFWVKIMRKTRINATSKERLCNIPRILPSLEKALVLLHPTNTTIYAPRPRREKNRNELHFIKSLFPAQGRIHAHIVINIIINKIGLITKIILCLLLIKNISLNRSFTPSATGCSRPKKETLLGPSRIWLSPSSFRSNRVTKATPPSPNRIRISCLTIHKNILRLKETVGFMLLRCRIITLGIRDTGIFLT